MSVRAPSTPRRSPASPPQPPSRSTIATIGRPASLSCATSSVERLLVAVPDARLNGDPRFDAAHRLPGNAHLSFPGCEGDSLLMLLDARGVQCSTGSACSAGVAEPSHVLLAMGASPAEARSSLRFSLGHTSTRADLDELVAAIGPVVERARAARSTTTTLPQWML